MKKTMTVLVVLIMLCSAVFANGGSEKAESKELPTIKICYELDFVPKDNKVIEAALSKITEEKCGCKVELVTIPQSSYGQQINLQLSSSSEPVDIIVLDGYSGVTAPVLVSKGALLPLDDLLEKYGQGIKDALGQYLAGGVVNGELYELCSIRNMALQWGVLIPKVYVDKYNIDIDSIHTEDDLTAIYEMVSAQEPDMIMVAPEAGMLSWYDESAYDPLGDKIGIIEDKGGSLTVTSLVESEDFAESCRRHSEWYKKGWISKDVLTSPDSSWDQMKAGKLFSCITTVKPGVETEKGIWAGGMEMCCAKLSQPLTFTSRASTYGWAIPFNSEHPEEAMKVLELMYTDEEFLNILDWGIEGTHYVKIDGYNNWITFPEGVTADTSGYYHGWNWMFGNQYISYVWESDSPTIYGELKEWNASAVVSEAMGFVWDYTKVKTEYTAVSNVNEKYISAITKGVMDYDTYIADYVAELKAAGIDKIIAEKQSQLDAWAEANNK